MINIAAQKLDIELPVAQGEVKSTIERLFVTLDQVRQAQRTVIKLIEIVRDGCAHPEKVEVIHTGHSFLRCTTCGKEW